MMNLIRPGPRYTLKEQLLAWKGFLVPSLGDEVMKHHTFVTLRDRIIFSFVYWIVNYA